LIKNLGLTGTFAFQSFRSFEKEKIMVRMECGDRTVWVVERLMVVIILIAIFNATKTEAHAVPTTFRFDATVTGVFPAGSFDSPVEFEVGDLIHGKLTFDPSLGAPYGDNAFDSNQGFPLEFDFNGSVVRTLQYRIRAINDSPILDSSTLPDVADDIVLRCSPSSLACMPNVISLPGADPFRMTVRMTLLGESSIFESAHVSGDVATWNAFSLERSLRVTFDNLVGGGVLLTATVGDFAAVPESTSLAMVVLCATLWAGFHRRTRKGNVA
jgi:hypothetical protein